MGMDLQKIDNTPASEIEFLFTAKPQRTQRLTFFSFFVERTENENVFYATA